MRWNFLWSLQDVDAVCLADFNSFAERGGVRHRRVMWWWPWKKKRELPEHLRTGEWGEAHAARFLKGAGFKVLGQRVHLGRDEIDLIARDGEVLVFVEVKTRRSENFGRAASAVDKRKRAILSRAAVHYLRRLRERPSYFRFDVVEVIGEMDAGEPVVRHIPNAFNLDARYRLPW